MLLLDVLRDIEGARFQCYDGNFDAARRRLSSIRAYVDVHESSRVTGELKLLEGLLAQATGDWSLALDCFRRAEILGRLAGDGDLIGLALSWMAHCGCNTGDTLWAAQTLVAASEFLGASRVEMRHRFSLVAAELSSFAKQLNAAKRWFDSSRNIAGMIGSRGLFSATVFNQSALHAWHFVFGSRFSEFQEVTAGGDPLVFLQSALNYDDISGVTVRVALHRVVQAQVLGVMGHHDAALLMLNQLIEEDADLGPMDRGRASLEIVWNEILKSDSDLRYSSLLAQVNQCFNDLVDEDDLAFGHSLLARLAHLMGDEAASLRHAQSSSYYLDLLRSRQSQVTSILGGGRLLDAVVAERLIKWNTANPR